MKTGVFYYINVRDVKNLTIKQGAKVSVRSEVCWDSENPDQKMRRIVVVDGILDSRGHSWPAKWEFEWPDQDVKKLEAGLGPIIRDVEGPDRSSRGLSRQKREEVFVDVYDWLRAGWVEGSARCYGYWAFRKDNLTLTSEFEDTGPFHEMRNALRATM
jgi:hypothetical protein